MISDTEFNRLCDDYIEGNITLDAFVTKAYSDDAAQLEKVKARFRQELNEFQAIQKPLRLVKGQST